MLVFNILLLNCKLTVDTHNLLTFVQADTYTSVHKYILCVHLYTLMCALVSVLKLPVILVAGNLLTGKHVTYR